ARAALEGGASGGRWRVGRLRFGLALLLYLASLGFRESAIALPLLAFGMEAWILDPARGSRSPGRLLRLALYALPLGAYLAARWSVVGTGPPTVPEVLAGATGLQRRLHGCETLLLYLGQLALPVRLCAEYEDFTRLVRPSLGDARVLASLLLWPALAFLCLRLARRGKLVPVYAAAWFFLAILPASHLLFTIGTVRAERLLFFPSLGFALALACLLFSLRRVRPILPLAALLPILGFYGWQTVRRNADWRSEDSLLAVSIRQNPGNARLWYSLGEARLKRGDGAGAEDALRRAIALHESAGFFPADVHTTYAHALLLRGDRDGALARYRRVLEFDPRRFGALAILGGILIQEPATRAEGIGLLQRAADARPGHPLPHLRLATAHRLAGDLPASLRSIEAAIRLEPELAESWIEKAQIHEAAGDAPSAAQA
ncbi:MAG: tetratricopeptide repeat protein, partial [Planctomycetota bacterium]